MTATNSPQLSPDLISREALARRWQVSKECVKRKERAGIITGIRFNARLLRYRLSEILRIEEEGMSRRPPVQLPPRRPEAGCSGANNSGASKE